RLAHRLERRAMDHGVERSRREDRVQAVHVADIDFVHRGWPADDASDPLGDIPFGVDEAVDDDRLVTGFGESHAYVAADEAGATGDHDTHRRDATTRAMVSRRSPRRAVSAETSPS